MRVCVLFQGRITVTGLLDREKGDMYTLTVVADDGGPKKDSTVVRPFVVNGVVSGLPLLLLCLVDLLLHVFVSILAQKANGLPLLLIASLSGTAEGKTFFLWGMLSTTVNAFAVERDHYVLFARVYLMFKVSITLQMWNLTSIRSYLCTGVHHHSG